MLIRILLNNWQYKLAALIIAIALEIYVSRVNDPHIAKSLNVPLALQSVPDNLQIADATPEVSLQLSGPMSSLDAITSSSYVASVDLAHVHSGLNDALPIIVNSSSGVPQDVAIESEMPRMASVTMDNKVRKQFDVEATFPSATPAGLSFGTPKVVPPVASIEGPESLVNRVARLVVHGDDAVNGESVTPGTLEGFGDVVPLDSQNLPVSGVSVMPQQAELRIPVVRTTAVKQMIVNPVITGSPAFPDQVTDVQAQPARLLVTGTPDVLAHASVLSTAPLDVTALKSSVTRQIAIVLPPGLRPENGVKATVAVTVRVTAPVTTSVVQPAKAAGAAPANPAQPGR